MRRSEPSHDSDWVGEGNTSHHWNTKTPTFTSGPRRVAPDDPWQGGNYPVPKPTYSTPEELDQKSDRADKTPYTLQSPAFKIHHDDDEMRSLKERMDRQEDLMDKMMHEIISLRQELKSNASHTAGPEKYRVNDYSSRDAGPGTLSGRKDAREGVPFAATQANQGRDYSESVRSCEAVEIQPKRSSGESPGAKFVAEFSELFELDSGQHALLASIMDRNLCHNPRRI